MNMLSVEKAGVQVELNAPAGLQAGALASYTIRLRDSLTGVPLTDLIASHERLLHLIIIRRDLQHFQHLHPRPTGHPGEFLADVSFPHNGEYLFFIEFSRKNGEHILYRETNVVGDEPLAMPALVEDNAPKTVGNVRIRLEEKVAEAGREETYIFSLEDARTGQPMQNLQPYLGAAAHVVILSEDAQTFGHAHGEFVAEGMEQRSGHHGHGMGHHHGQGMQMPSASARVRFQHTFPATGRYKIWGEFQNREGEIIRADFVVRAR